METHLLIFPVNQSVFSPNVGKYGPKNPPYLETFHAVVDYRSSPWQTSLLLVSFFSSAEFGEKFWRRFEMIISSLWHMFRIKVLGFAESNYPFP